MTKKGAKKRASEPAKPADLEAPEPEGFTQEEIARRVGCAKSTVWRALARGDIEPLENGRLPESAIDVLRDARIEDERRSGETADLEKRLLSAQANEREAKAQLRKLELERESGRFVDLAAVQHDAADTRERVVAVLRAIPQRCAMAVDAALAAPAERRAAVVEQLIGREVERAISELAEAKYGGAR